MNDPKEVLAKLAKKAPGGLTRAQARILGTAVRVQLESADGPKAEVTVIYNHNNEPMLPAGFAPSWAEQSNALYCPVDIAALANGELVETVSMDGKAPN